MCLRFVLMLLSASFSTVLCSSPIRLLNNLGKPLYSTALNLGKATIGTLPFVYVGAQWYGALGVLYGQAVGTIVFGLIAMLVLNKHIADVMKGQEPEPVEDDPSITCVNTQPFLFSRCCFD